MPNFDPDAAARPGSGIFGLPHDATNADLVLVPVPFDATTSYGGGACEGPDAIRVASAQVDLFDLQTGHPYRRGIHMLPTPQALRTLSREMRALAEPMIERGGADPQDPAERRLLDRIDEAGEQVNAYVHNAVTDLLRAGKLPGVVGGDHSTPFGAIQALAEAHPGLGILHVDAHADLRIAYEGFQWSHASIMDNVLRRIPQVARLVQVGIRDFGAAELAAIHAHPERITTHFDIDWQRRLASGDRYLDLCRLAVEGLPEKVYISFDIDGLDPSLCPGTGTPVPGGPNFAQACLLLETLVESGRKIVGFDLNEVAPQDGDGEWNANVGARLLYKLCGFALLSQ